MRTNISSYIRSKAKKVLATVVVSGALLLPGTTHALEYHLSAHTIANGYWASGDIPLTSTTIGPTPLFINIFLSHPLTANGWLGFGFGGINPPLSSGQGFTFSTQLLLNGAAVAPASTISATAFGNGVSGLYNYNFFGIAAGMNFNEIQISVTSPTVRSVGSFYSAVGVGAVPEGAVPFWVLLPLLGGLCLIHRVVQRTPSRATSRR